MEREEDPDEELCLHLKELLDQERKWCSCFGWIDHQPAINEKMRVIVVDWMLEVANEYNLKHFTIHRAVGLLDLVLTKMQCERKHLQLASVTCILIAAKFEEIYPPSIDEMAYIADHTYTTKQIGDMEWKILGCIDWKIRQPTSHEWLEWWIFCASEETEAISCVTATIDQQIARKALIANLLEYESLKYPPSKLARAALTVGALITGDLQAQNTELVALMLDWVVRYTDPSCELDGARMFLKRHADVNETIQTRGKVLRDAATQRACKKFHRLSTPNVYRQHSDEAKALRRSR